MWDSGVHLTDLLVRVLCFLECRPEKIWWALWFHFISTVYIIEEKRENISPLCRHVMEGRKKFCGPNSMEYIPREWFFQQHILNHAIKKGKRFLVP